MNNKIRLHKIFYNALLTNAIMGLIMLILIYASVPLLKIANQPQEVIHLATPYIYWVGFSVLFVMIFQAMKQFADGLGFTKISMYAILLTNVINVLVSYVLIYGVWIFPRLEVLGAGLGTVFARFIILFVFWYLLWKHPSTHQYVAYIPKKVLDFSIIRQLLSLGFPSGFQSVFEMGIFTASVWLAGTLGTLSQAANQIALQMASMTFMIFVGFGVAATIRVGYRYGRKEYRDLRQIAFSIFLQSAMVGFFFSILYITLRKILPWIYLSKNQGEDVMQVAGLAAGLLVIGGIFQISDSLQITLQGALRGLQDVKVPMVLTFISYWLIGFPVAWFASKTWGVYGIWIGLLTGLTMAAILLFIRFYYISKKLIDHENA